VIGVLVPAHNEAELLGACLASLQQAALHPELNAETVCILVVLDACTDDSETVAHAWGVAVLRVDERNVGHARRAGAAHLLELGARWLACTDADSSVDRDWLVRQLAFGADVVCGTVRVADWSSRTEQVRRVYEGRYQSSEDHRHIHGANLGVCARAYQRAGGFRPLPADEDVHLVRDLERSGARIVWTHHTCVTTSARRDCRARHGFGEFLDGLASP
jgi:glycosyltransferase involved in cell wall biosynthesis